MKAVVAARAVGEPVLERQAHGAEGDVLPGQLRLLEQGHFQALDAGLELQIEQAGAVEQVHLADAHRFAEAEPSLYAATRSKAEEIAPLVVFALFLTVGTLPLLPL